MQRLLRQVAIAVVVPVFFGIGCRSSQPSEVTRTPATPATVPTHIVSKKTNAKFKCIALGERDEAEEPFETHPVDALGRPRPGGGDNFTGTDRKAAKIAIVDAPTVTFADLDGLFSSGLLKLDSDMLSHDPPITHAADEDRVAEEKHNVVVNAYLYASARESDNDFHCIIGRGPGEPEQFLNVEVSGLPPDGPNRARLKAVRDKFKDFFADSPISQGYTKFDPPIPVRISGSLFFDVDHPAGKVGPDGMRPTTAWEIHPVSDIEFEP